MRVEDRKRVFGQELQAGCIEDDNPIQHLRVVVREVQGKSAARSGDSLTTGQMQHIGIFAAIGAVIGLGAGFVVGRR